MNELPFLFETGGGLAVLKGKSKYWEQKDAPNGRTVILVGKERKLNIGDVTDEMFAHPEDFSFECGTAMNILAMKAEADYTRAFGKTEQLEKTDLKLASYYFGATWGTVSERIGRRPYLPGDIRYIDNPNFTNVNWRGENLLYLGNGRYFGFGRGANKGIMTGADWLKLIRDNYTEKGKEDTVRFLPVIRRVMAPFNPSREGSDLP
jgi:protein-glutamine gamma-glutamyltransferase